MRVASVSARSLPRHKSLHPPTPDEVSAVVFDIGGCLCRAGYAGDDLPRAVYPSSAGVVPRAGGGGGRDVFVGNAALALRREGMEVVGALGSDDLIADADVYNRLIDYAMRCAPLSVCFAVCWHSERVCLSVAAPLRCAAPAALATLVSTLAVPNKLPSGTQSGVLT